MAMSAMAPILSLLLAAAAAYAWLTDGASTPRRLIAPHHKSGFVFSYQLVEQLRRAGASDVEFLGDWPGNLRLFRRKVTSGTRTPHKTSMVVNIVRDPFDMVVSGTLYHRGGAECTSACCERNDWAAPTPHRGIAHLAQYHAQYGLPAPAKHDRWYCSYLKRLNTSQALLAEMVRAHASDIKEMAGAFETTRQHPRSMTSVCLERFEAGPQSFNRTMGHVLATLKLSHRPELLLLGAGGRTSTSTTKYKGPHSVTRGLSPAAKLVLSRTARRLDAKHFGGAFGRLARALRCSHGGGNNRHV